MPVTLLIPEHAGQVQRVGAVGEGFRLFTDEGVEAASVKSQFGRTTPQHDPSWITWFDEAELYGDTRHAYYTLALKPESGQVSAQLLR